MPPIAHSERGKRGIVGQTIDGRDQVCSHGASNGQGVERDQQHIELIWMPKKELGDPSRRAEDSD